ncbi:MAG: hypothetical protein SAL70_40015 [Scytonema sp. PMC 1070.18]|nr:hypothetical protein [Scytonema sp. PMC 1070.18]
MTPLQQRMNTRKAAKLDRPIKEHRQLSMNLGLSLTVFFFLRFTFDALYNV